jgi:hypothetical protein
LTVGKYIENSVVLRESKLNIRWCGKKVIPGTCEIHAFTFPWTFICQKCHSDQPICNFFY